MLQSFQIRRESCKPLFKLQQVLALFSDNSIGIVITITLSKLTRLTNIPLALVFVLNIYEKGRGAHCREGRMSNEVLRHDWRDWSSTTLLTRAYNYRGCAWFRRQRCVPSEAAMNLLGMISCLFVSSWSWLIKLFARIHLLRTLTKSIQKVPNLTVSRRFDFFGFVRTTPMLAISLPCRSRWFLRLRAMWILAGLEVWLCKIIFVPCRPMLATVLNLEVRQFLASRFTDRCRANCGVANSLSWTHPRRSQQWQASTWVWILLWTSEIL